MNFLRIVQLLTYSFGVYAFGSLSLLWFRSTSSEVQSTDARRVGPDVSCSRYSRLAGNAMMIVCFSWFLVALLTTLVSLAPGLRANWLQVLQVVLMFQFPPLIAWMNYVDLRHPDGLLRSPAWRASLIGIWVISEGLLAYVLLALYGGLPKVPSFGAFIGLSISAMFAATAIFSALAMHRGRMRRETVTERSGRRWMLALYLLMFALVFLIVGAHFADLAIAELFGFIGSAMPLIFMFTVTYHESRFEFFDVFIKRGAMVLNTIIVLTVLFWLILPLLESFELEWARPWAYAVVMLPVVLSAPWIYRETGEWLDDKWLGRRLTPVEAIKRFVSDLGCACDRETVIGKAETGLAEIFDAPVRINLNLSEAPDLDFDCVLDVPVVSNGRRVGAILMGRRANQVPYFSQDLELLDSLANVFSYVLETVELYEKKQEQEQLTRELSIQASQSELKALRAQINPHFLFNALNAIAGLIHKDPFRADQTVEQLADIFRYTLRGSESEWAQLGDEMDFARSYLEVERARFGEKLQVRVEASTEASGLRIPTMMVQTLVENAVKHGVARVRGPSSVELSARRDGDRLLIEVADSGPGFEVGDDSGPGRRDRAPKSGGFGLHNVRERLAGHFDERAELTVRRDTAREMTVVSLSMPIDALERMQGQGRQDGVA
jgi:anti-sigma regulatory factor (Ser/Thr protein kinase)